MTIRYYCNAGTLAHANCVDGDDSADGLTPATARQTLAKLVTDWQAGAAGDQFLLAEGACWDSAATGQMHNTNATKESPVVIDSYDASSVWSGGAGIKPILRNPASADIININKGTLVHTEGYVFRSLDVRGEGTNTLRGILGGGDCDYVTVEDMEFSGLGVGIQAFSSTSPTALTSDGITSHWRVQRNTFSNMSGVGCLIGVSHLVIEDNDLDHCGQTVFDHGIYVGGDTTRVYAQGIASITGDGVTATLTTLVAHEVDPAWHFTIGVSGSTVAGGGSGTFNVTGGVGSGAARGTVTGPNTITFPATGTPNADTLGAYTITRDVELEDVVIRGNTLSEGHTGAAGQNNNAHIVFHGRSRRLLIENNTISESVASSGTSSAGIEIDTGSYSQPEEYDGFNQVVVRGNTVSRCQIGIGLDISQDAIVEDNFVFTDYTASQAHGIVMRSKVGSAILPTNLNPERNIIRYNTIHLKDAIANSEAIAIDKHASDTEGTGHQIHSNLIVLEAPAAATVMALRTSNMTSAAFDIKDRNYCYWTNAGFTPKWENTFALGAHTTGGDASSVMAVTADLATAQPFFTAAGSSPAVGSSFAGKDNAHPTLRPYSAWGGVRREKLPSDVGAFEIGAAALIPNSPTRLAVQ